MCIWPEHERTLWRGAGDRSPSAH